jgi:hypothetical protein
VFRPARRARNDARNCPKALVSEEIPRLAIALFALYCLNEDE